MYKVPEVFAANCAQYSNTGRAYYTRQNNRDQKAFSLLRVSCLKTLIRRSVALSCVYVHVHVHVHVRIHVHVHVHVYTCTCTCIYMYMYMYIHVHVCAPLLRSAGDSGRGISSTM